MCVCVRVRAHGHGADTYGHGDDMYGHGLVLTHPSNVKDMHHLHHLETFHSVCAWQCALRTNHCRDGRICTCMHVPKYVCARVRVHVCVCACVRACTCVCVCAVLCVVCCEVWGGGARGVV